MTARDVRDTATFREIQEHFERAYAPAFGRPSHASEPAITRDGGRIAVTVSVMDQLEGLPGSRIALVESGGLRVITNGPGDRYPRWSPDGTTLSFLSDRAEAGVHQLHLLRDGVGEALTTPAVDGVVEYAAWSPDGASLLLGVAGRGADAAGGQGSGTLPGEKAVDLPAWMPEVLGPGELATAWRGLHIYDVATDTIRPFGPPGRCIWEACWAGSGAIAAIVSDSPGEESWYTARLVLLDIASGAESVLYRSDVQIGTVSAAPSGGRVAVIEATCSDRGIVAGDLLIVDPATGSATRIDTAGVDVSASFWRDDRVLVWIGLRGMEMTAGELDVESGAVRETWRTDEAAGTRYPDGAVAADGSLAVVLESYARYPTVVLVREGVVHEVASLDHAGADYLRSVSGEIRRLTWRGCDGLEIEGLVTTPPGPGPFPLVVLVHGGPVWCHANRWTMRNHFGHVLVSRGYAVLYPNPRGSGGRGQAFARAVLGDMGGEDARDILAGVDALVAEGVADPSRLAVTGGSYGGFMSAWLITIDDRFGAAIPFAETSNWYSQHFTSNISHFDTLFFGADVEEPGGMHFTRSPVMYASRVTTPTLHITGADDRCTPPGQAIEYHRALVERGAHSECVVYPGEGHGIRRFPAVIDQLARIVDFLGEHLGMREGSTR
jgi:dipeptidyl aminopeptidase/acylaminoacyl peptidase